MASTLGAHNPLRYRGYVYETETTLYYLQSRYYDPDLGRFLNADAFASTGQGILGNNMFAYCGNNPVSRKDTNGEAFETVFDIVSLGFSIAEVAANPYDPMAWAGLVGDTVDLIPFVTGVGETVRGLRFIDKLGNTLEIAKATDFTDDAAKLIKKLDTDDIFTKSNRFDGRDIHTGYKRGPGFSDEYKEYRRKQGIRPDYFDRDNHIIYELKPYNPASAKAGIRQLGKYNTYLGGGNTMRLEFY